MRKAVIATAFFLHGTIVDRYHARANAQYRYPQLVVAARLAIDP